MVWPLVGEGFSSSEVKAGSTWKVFAWVQGGSPPPPGLFAGFPAVDGVASVWAGVLAHPQGDPFGADQGQGHLVEASVHWRVVWTVQGPGRLDHFRFFCGVPHAVLLKPQVEEGQGHLDRPGVTWRHGGIRLECACPETRCTPSPLGGPDSCGNGHSCRGRRPSSLGKMLSPWGP